MTTDASGVVPNDGTTPEPPTMPLPETGRWPFGGVDGGVGGRDARDRDHAIGVEKGEPQPVREVDRHESHRQEIRVHAGIAPGRGVA